MDMPLDAASLKARLESREAAVAVLGMGYVGLPLAMAAHDARFSVLGYDVDPAKVESLNAGRSYIQHIRPGKVAEMASSDRFRATGRREDLARADVLVICVPTPLTRQREPDMTFVDATTETLASILRPGQLVVLESTTYPGTTEERLKPRLESGGLRCGRDFFLAFSPEREDPGNPRFGTTNTPKLVGGVDPLSGDLAEAFYGALVEKVVRVKDARTAEAAKLTENVFRAVNIALVNELKMIYDRMGIDVWEVLDAASTKPFGFMRFNPGPGWGGTASRWTPSTSRGRPGSTACPPTSSSTPARSTAACPSTSSRS
jgi:UDP-N-acetyl-D-glucosamine dehydrogenase